MSHRVSASSTQKRGRTSDGCLPCRRRKKRCDLRKPTCLACERNVLICSWMAGSSVPQPNQDYSRTTPTITSPSDAIPLASSLLRCHQPSVSHRILESPLSSLLYRHWLEKTGDVMSAHRGPLNSFITVLPRLALSYPDTVLQSLLALSGIHYANRCENSNLSVMTYTHLGLAFRALKHGLTTHAAQSLADPVPLLTTTLVLCFVETTRGDHMGNILHHLDAARILMDQLLSSPAVRTVDDSVLEFLKEFYVYIESITCLTGSELSSSASPKLLSMEDMALSPDHNSGILLGCSHELFNMIPEIRRMVQRLRPLAGTNVESIGVDEEWFEDTTYRDLHSRICLWTPPDGSVTDFATCGLLYQQAVLCYLETALGHANTVHHCEKRLLGFIKLLHLLPTDAPISATLNWPLVLFGVLAESESHRAYIYYRLACMWESLGLMNIKKSMEFLKRYWTESISTEALVQGRCSLESDLGSNHETDER